MLEKLMLKREHFPLELLDYNGKPFANRNIIPPFHNIFVQNGIDLDLAFSVIDDAVENTKLDLNESTLRTDVPPAEFDAIGNVIYGPVKKDNSCIYFRDFPFTDGLCIQKQKISPYGHDSYIQIIPDSHSTSYQIPKNLPLSSELLKEYNMVQKNTNMYLQVTCKIGWMSHNVDFRDVFYKNLIITLNNAVVKKKYSK